MVCAYACKWESVVGSDDVGQSDEVGGGRHPVPDGGHSAPAEAAAVRRSARWRRRALSVNQDLTALAGLVHDAAYRRRYNHAMSTLDQLGKRRAPADDDDQLGDLWLLQLRRRRR